MNILIIILIIIVILTISFYKYIKENFVNYAPANIILYDTIPDNNPSLFYNYVMTNPDFYWYNPLDYWLNPYISYYWKTQHFRRKNIQYTMPIYNNRHTRHINKHFRR